jgi:queuosine precursor transporter
VLIFAIAVYAATIIAANLLVAQFGPAITPLLAFFCIGLDLALRDWLQIRLARWHMAALIVCTGIVTYLLNPAADKIALASAASFMVAALADWWAFNTLAGSWLRRSVGSNVVGAAVDSLMFPTLAFGALLPGIVAAQFIAKTAGGALWTWLLNRADSRP